MTLVFICVILLVTVELCSWHSQWLVIILLALLSVSFCVCVWTHNLWPLAESISVAFSLCTICMCACTLTAMVEYVYWGWGCDVFGCYYHFHVCLFLLSTSYWGPVMQFIFKVLQLKGWCYGLRVWPILGTVFTVCFFLGVGDGGGWQSREGLGYLWFASPSLWKLFLHSFFISNFSLILFSSFEKIKNTSEHGSHRACTQNRYMQFSKEVKTLGWRIYGDRKTNRRTQL